MLFDITEVIPLQLYYSLFEQINQSRIIEIWRKREYFVEKAIKTDFKHQNRFDEKAPGGQLFEIYEQ